MIFNGWVFQENGLCDAPELKFRKKKLAEFSSKTAFVAARKMKIRENFWMSFPRFANKG